MHSVKRPETSSATLLLHVGSLCQNMAKGVIHTQLSQQHHQTY